MSQLKGDSKGNHEDIKSSEVKTKLNTKFNDMWSAVVKSSTKLRYYSLVKDDIKFEPYLKLENRGIRKVLTRLRSSSHRLNVETARYIGNKNKALASHNKAWSKSCKICCNSDVELWLQLPFADPPIVEDEQHVVAICPAYHHLRLLTSDYVKSAIVAWDERLPALFEEPHVHEFGAYVNNIFKARFPKTKEQTIKRDTKPSKCDSK